MKRQRGDVIAVLAIVALLALHVGSGAASAQTTGDYYNDGYEKKTDKADGAVKGKPSSDPQYSSDSPSDLERGMRRGGPRPHTIHRPHRPHHHHRPHHITHRPHHHHRPHHRFPPRPPWWVSPVIVPGPVVVPADPIVIDPEPMIIDDEPSFDDPQPMVNDWEPTYDDSDPMDAD